MFGFDRARSKFKRDSFIILPEPDDTTERNVIRTQGKEETNQGLLQQALEVRARREDIDTVRLGGARDIGILV